MEIRRYQRNNQKVQKGHQNVHVPKWYAEGTKGKIGRYQRVNQKIQKGEQNVPKGVTRRYQIVIRRYQKG
jgi:hypothetical protein